MTICSGSYSTRPISTCSAAMRAIVATTTTTGTMRATVTWIEDCATARRIRFWRARAFCFWDAQHWRGDRLPLLWYWSHAVGDHSFKRRSLALLAATGSAQRAVFQRCRMRFRRRAGAARSGPARPRPIDSLVPMACAILGGEMPNACLNSYPKSCENDHVECPISAGVERLHCSREVPGTRSGGVQSLVVSRVFRFSRSVILQSVCVRGRGPSTSIIHLVNISTKP
jgi:hypothetical protein